MRLIDLVKLNEAKTLKVKRDDVSGVISVGGVVVSPEESIRLLEGLGWLEYDLDPLEILNKTDKFASSIKRYIKDENILSKTEVTFQNRRITNTMQYFDRIKLICPGKFDLTILYGMPGTGCKYAVYSSKNYFRIPVQRCKSLKEVCEYINSII